MVEIKSEEITSPRGVAKLHTFVTHDETTFIKDAKEFDARIIEANPNEVVGEFSNPGYYFFHRLDQAGSLMVRPVPDYKNDVAAVMGLMALCITGRDWLFSISLGRNTPAIVDIVYFEKKTPYRAMGNTIGDAILGGIYMGLALELYSKEEKTKGEPWLM